MTYTYASNNLCTSVLSRYERELADAVRYALYAEVWSSAFSKLWLDQGR